MQLRPGAGKAPSHLAGEGGGEGAGGPGRGGEPAGRAGAQTSPATCAHRHTIPWELAPGTAVCKQSLPLGGGPLSRRRPAPPRGNPRSGLGPGLADVCEKGRLPLPTRILQTMGRPRPGIPTGLPTGHSDRPGSQPPRRVGCPSVGWGFPLPLGSPWHQLPSHSNPGPPWHVSPETLSWGCWCC